MKISSFLQFFPTRLSGEQVLGFSHHEAVMNHLLWSLIYVQRIPSWQFFHYHKPFLIWKWLCCVAQPCKGPVADLCLLWWTTELQPWWTTTCCVEMGSRTKVPPIPDVAPHLCNSSAQAPCWGMEKERKQSLNYEINFVCFKHWLWYSGGTIPALLTLWNVRKFAKKQQSSQQAVALRW